MWIQVKAIINAINFALFMDSRLDKAQFHDLLGEKQLKKDAIGTLVINGEDFFGGVRSEGSGVSFLVVLRGVDGILE